MTKNELIEKIEEFKLSIPVSDNLSELKKSRKLFGTPYTLKNSITVHPIEVFRNDTDGSPNEMTYRQYNRFAESGASLIWFEAVAVQDDAKSTPYQLCLREDNIDSFKRLVDMIHEKSGGIPVIIQLTHSGRFSKPNGKPAPIITYHNPIMNKTLDIPSDYPVVSDEYLEKLEETFVKAAILSERAGFDGIDVKVCHRYLLGEIVSAYLRSGKYGGCYENRVRLVRDIVRGTKQVISQKTILSSRFGVYDGFEYPYGFGANKDDYTVPDLEEPLSLIGDLREDGITTINFTMGAPYVNPHINRPYSHGAYLPQEHPLAGVDRLIKHAGICQRAYPDLNFIGTGYSYLGEAAQYAAAGALETGMVTAVGFGRMAVAYPNYANDMVNECFDKNKTCTTCGKCIELVRAGGPTGCILRDSEMFAPLYRQYVQKKD